MDDAQRQIRFLYPPFVFLSLVAAGLACDSDLRRVFEWVPEDGIGLAALVAALGGAALPCGFVFAVVGIFLSNMRKHVPAPWSSSPTCTEPEPLTRRSREKLLKTGKASLRPAVGEA